MKAAGLPVIGLDRPSRGQAPDRMRVVGLTPRHGASSLSACKRSASTSALLSHKSEGNASMNLFDHILRILLGFLLAAAISAMMRDRDHEEELKALRTEIEMLQTKLPSLQASKLPQATEGSLP